MSLTVPQITTTASDHVIEDAKFLHRPITATIGGQPCNFYTIGYVCRILGRERWTVLQWEKNLGLRTPFTLRGTRIRLFPESFLLELEVIVSHGYLCKRLKWDDWKRFHYELHEAYEKTITPLLISKGITETDTHDAATPTCDQAIGSQL